MSIGTKRQIAAKREELRQLNEEIEKAQVLCYRISNQSVQYHSTNGLTLDEMQNEERNILKSLGYKEGQTNDIIQLFRMKVKTRQKQEIEYAEEYKRLRQEIEEIKSKTEKITIPEAKIVQQDDIPIITDIDNSQYFEFLKSMRKNISLMKIDFNQYRLTLQKKLDDVKRVAFFEMQQIILKAKSESKNNESEIQNLQKENEEYSQKINELEKLPKKAVPKEPIPSGPDPELTKKECIRKTQTLAQEFHKLQKKAEVMIRNNVFVDINAKFDELGGRTAAIKQKIEKIARKKQKEVKKSAQISSLQAQQDFRILMQTILKKTIIDQMLENLSPMLGSEAQKLEEQLEKEKSEKGKIIDDGLTLSELRKAIARLEKENARENLDGEDYMKRKREEILRVQSNTSSQVEKLASGEILPE